MVEIKPKIKGEGVLKILNYKIFKIEEKQNLRKGPYNKKRDSLFLSGIKMERGSKYRTINLSPRPFDGCVRNFANDTYTTI